MEEMCNSHYFYIFYFMYILIRSASSTTRSKEHVGTLFIFASKIPLGNTNYTLCGHKIKSTLVQRKKCKLINKRISFETEKT
jgi:hypothetical protein